MNEDTKHSSCVKLRFAVAIAAVLAVGVARATSMSYCVSTPAEFQAAFDDVSDGGQNNGADATVRVVTGTYAVSSTLTYLNSASTGTLDIEGGYNAGCGTRSGDASLTILDGGGTTRVMYIDNQDADTTISGLTFQGGHIVGQLAGGLLADGLGPDVANVAIVNNVFRGNRAEAAGALFTGTGGATKVVLVRGNVFVDNSAASGAGAAEVIVNAGHAQLYGNTVAQNTMDNSDTGGLYCGGNGTFDVANNILWANDNSDLRLQVGGAALDYNDIGVRAGGTVPVEDVGNLSVDAKFVDGSSGNFHLAGDSPLLAASPLPLGILDVEGRPYPAAGWQDLGAYAETIFDDPFDPIGP